MVAVYRHDITRKHMMLLPALDGYPTSEASHQRNHIILKDMIQAVWTSVEHDTDAKLRQLTAVNQDTWEPNTGDEYCGDQFLGFLKFAWGPHYTSEPDYGRPFLLLSTPDEWEAGTR